MTSEHCKEVLDRAPPCGDTSGVRSFAMCSAWDRVARQKIPFAQAIRASWKDIKKVCQK